ncbi:MAG TPA: 50S ribosomal protein L21, partial [Actinomycetota bacterium]|nr:50S ribosomal protein L21 [Actinomycetota bacterium]
MYAVVRVGGKQQRVEPGDVIEVEYMKKLDPGSTVELDTLFVMEDGTVHRPKGGTVKVVGRLVGEKKGDKIKVFKYRNKSGYARTQGHRQLMTELEIEEIVVGDKVLRKPEPAQEAATGSGEDAKKTT